MGFVQIVEFRTSNIDEIQNLDLEWEKATEGQRTARRAVIAQDRNDPGRYLTIVFFDSYEDAMKNSELPATQEFAAKINGLVEGDTKFHDLDVIDDRSV